MNNYLIYKKYLKKISITILCLLLVVAGFNYLVNPFGIYEPPAIEGVNGRYPAASTFARLYKLEAIKRHKPDTLILGTSRADIGLNPTLELFPNARVYNAALSASTVYEQRYVMEFANHVNPLKRVIITLDFFAYNANKLVHTEFNPERLSASALAGMTPLFDTYGTLLSLNTVSTSLKHLRRMKKKERYSHPRENGHKIHLAGAWEIRQKGAHALFSKPPKQNGVQVSDYKFEYSDKPGDTSFQHLSAMLDFARERDIEVILFFSPVHSSHLNVLKAKGQWNLFEEWKEGVFLATQRNALKYATIPYDLWDFATYNRFTNEPVPDATDTETQMKWFWDGHHYKEDLGNIILQKMLGQLEEGAYREFGILR